MRSTKTHVLMIEDDEQDAEIVRSFLDNLPQLPLILQHKHTLSESINFLHNNESIDLILLDLTLSDAKGLDTFHQVHQAFPQKPLIILSGNSNQAVVQETLKEGATDFLIKGTFDSSALCYSIQHALEIQKQKLELELQNNALQALSKQLEIAQSEIKKLETIDSLTNFYNRTQFDDVFLSEWKRLQREEQPLALILCELDPIEAEIDPVSTTWEDHILHQIAEVMFHIIKRPADCVARYSENQFVILLPNTDILGATFIAEAIRIQVQKLGADYLSTSHHQPTTLSFGITGHVPRYLEAPSLLIEAAHQALIGAKARGRHQVNWQTIRDAKSELYTRQTLHWVGKLHQALQNDLFKLYVQPIHSLNRVSSIESFDILLRLCDQSGRACAPEMFLPMLEQYDFMAQIDQWMIEHLLLEHTQIYAHKKFEAIYFIKLSAATCKAGNLSELVQQQLNLYDFPASQLCFEISESVALKNLSSAVKLSQSLKALGCQIALDDFGVDFKTFKQLKPIKADYVKINGELVEGITEDPILHGILESIKRVADVMNSKTIAKQVRSEMTLNALDNLGINYAQGNHFERALPLKQYMSMQPSSMAH
ncbi:EAL domain-containing protein [Acaryochloris sp. 'Moss Beach']|uniref:EAL domain-containing response regulator n=1 Tax=Acaryochloris sp. 'Moss Beach' TaxID=2740837 RepID=UPI001F2E616B|nr:EAL domain-containing protein [Acaryochloris sp. 'Moss Beach']UJB68972.1 EAL domain-containing protein [Acaryochloris sp. 'Moss Beach']